MKIVSLQAENIKKLVAINITPDGNVVKITGKNEQGKSSVIDCIWFALGGKDIIPDQPIRKGEEEAKIEIDLGDIVVTRKFTEKGTSLTVENKDGAVYNSPQKMLDDLIGQLSFDPMNFIRLKAAEQFQTLAEHAGVDFAELDAERKELFDERTNVNRDGKNKAAEVEALAADVPEDAPDEVVSVAELAEKLTAASEKNSEILGVLNMIQHQTDEITFVENEISKLKERLKIALNKRGDLDNKKRDMKSIDTEELENQIKNAETNNTAARAKTKLTEENLILEKLRAQSKGLTADIESCDKKRAKMIADAKLPIKGLSFGEDIVIYNDIPLEQCSSSEQLRVSVAIAMAMNPKLRVIRIQDGSLLDSDSMKVIEEMAKAKDFQFWIEQVDESGKVGIVIEDGQVVAVNK